MSTKKKRFTLEALPTASIYDFAEENGLSIVVTERKKPIGGASRYYARFNDVEIMEGGCLRSTFGDGATPESAIAAYAEAISLRRIAISAMQSTRRELETPRLTTEETR